MVGAAPFLVKTGAVAEIIVPICGRTAFSAGISHVAIETPHNKKDLVGRMKSQDQYAENPANCQRYGNEAHETFNTESGGTRGVTVGPPSTAGYVRLP